MKYTSSYKNMEYIGTAVVFGILLLTLACGKRPTIRNHHKLFLFSIDGMKWSYFETLKKMPGFQYLAENGVRAKFMTPPFPTFTSPAHMTMATGLYAESHGVVHNLYHDLQNSSNRRLNYYETLLVNDWWNTGIEPIWITSSNQGLKSGGYLFPGSTATYNGKSASRSILLAEDSLNNEKAWKDRIDEVMRWFAEEDFDFVALYMEEPDVQSHAHGSESPTILNDVLPQIDRTLQHLFDSVKSHNLQDDLNIIITSDHGMMEVDTTVKSDEAISLMKYVKPEWIAFQLCEGPIAFVEPVPGYESVVYDGLRVGSDKMDVYYREDIPERFHYRNNERIPKIVIVAKPKYEVYDIFPGFHRNNAMHGYDNMLEDMRTIYFSIGPSFKKGVTIDGFDSVNIYPLMCYLLGLEPAENNGTLDALYPTLLPTYQHMEL